MRTLVVAAVLLGCGTAKHTPAPIASSAPTSPPTSAPAETTAPDPADPADPADPNGPAAAVPIPDESAPPPPLEMIDTTISEGELAAITGWPAAKTVASSGEVWVVLHTAENDKLELALVRDDEGVRASYPLGKAKPIATELTYDGNAFPARDHTGDYQGSIVFAARVTTPGKDTQDQIVVFAAGTTLRVARRALGAAAWKPLLALAFRTGTTFRGIGTTDPH